MRCLIACLVVITSACSTQRATPEDCQLILGRIVELELAEIGFRDPVLAARKKEEVARRYEPELSGCVGKPFSTEDRRCVADARSAEALIHTCLR